HHHLAVGGPGLDHVAVRLRGDDAPRPLGGATRHDHQRRCRGTAVPLRRGWVVVAARPQLDLGYLRIGEVGVLVLAGFFVATVGLLAQSRRRHLVALEDRAAQLARERGARATIAAAEERSRIAREIHDIVSHSVGTMVVMADGAVQTIRTDPGRAGTAMERVRDTGRGAMTEMRRMLDVLRDGDTAPRAPQPGLVDLE